jgi:hypothetical protein
MESSNNRNNRATFRMRAGLVVGAAFIVFVSGCAGLREFGRGIAGTSTKILEQGRGSAVTATFNLNREACYTQTRDFLDLTNAYIYARDAQQTMLAIYVSQADTTPVGIFFKSTDDTHTVVEVTSPSTQAKEFIATRLFQVLRGETLSPRLGERAPDSNATKP